MPLFSAREHMLECSYNGSQFNNTLVKNQAVQEDCGLGVHQNSGSQK